MQLTLDRQAAASPAVSVVLDYPGGRQTAELDDSGSARVRPFRATRVDVHLEVGKEPRASSPTAAGCPWASA